MLDFNAERGHSFWEQLKISFFKTVASSSPTLECLGAVCRLSSVFLAHTGCAGCSHCLHWMCPLKDSNKSQAAPHLQPQGSIMCMDMVYVEELTVQLSWLMRATLEIKGSV